MTGTEVLNGIREVMDEIQEVTERLTQVARPDESRRILACSTYASRWCSKVALQISADMGCRAVRLSTAHQNHVLVLREQVEVADPEAVSLAMELFEGCFARVAQMVEALE